MVDYEKLPSRCTDLTQQADRKNQSQRTSWVIQPSSNGQATKSFQAGAQASYGNQQEWSTTKWINAEALIWPSKQAERIKAGEQARLFNNPQWSTTKSFQAGALIWPSKQAERIKAEWTRELFNHPATVRLWKESKADEQASYVNDSASGRLRKASIAVVLIWPSKQTERIKAEEQASYSTIHNGRLRKASKQLHWFDPAKRQKESEQKTDLTQQAGRKNQRKRT